MKHKIKFKMITFGCAANQADSKTMKKILLDKYEESENPDVVIFNTCGVKGVTENKIIYQIKQVKNKRVIIAGCLSKISTKRLEEEFPNYSLIGPDQILDIDKIVDSVMGGSKVVELSSKYCERLVDTEGKDVEIVPISQGCFGNCAFCSTRFARGTLMSYPVEKIVEKIKNSDAKMFYITSQDNGCYGLDIGTSLIPLLKEIISVKKDFKIRVGMMNPNYVTSMLDDLIEIYKSDKVIKFIHIPVQSGSDKVLEEMNRKYKVEDFEHMVGIFREKIPNIVISTDVIVGYPTETEEDFQKTMKLVERINPEVLNISKFYSRPGTDASKLKQLTTQEMKSRSRELSKLYRSLRTRV